MRRIALLLLAAFSVGALAATLPYDPSANAKQDVAKAFAAAKSRHVPVLIVFGANWCEDCRALDGALRKERAASLMTGSFQVVKVDVGEFDRNLDVNATYGDPIKGGIPAAVLVAPEGKLLYSTKAGELANARTMSESSIYDFFKRVSQGAAAKK
ncbi:MAG: thioredoxin family protein [Rhizobiaceae bacterium]|nr:MAG: thioredoxin family protein [Rhizobiaceae bacterium]